MVEVSLPNRNLDGIIPTGFGSLSVLTALDLSSNSLTGQIPEETQQPDPSDSVAACGQPLHRVRFQRACGGS